MKILENPHEQTFAGLEVEKVLGADITQSLNLLADLLAPFEEWAQEGDITLLEAMELMKNEGLFRDLKVLTDIGEQMSALHAGIRSKMLRTYGRIKPDKFANETSKITTALNALLSPQRPLMNQIIFFADAARGRSEFIHNLNVVLADERAADAPVEGAGHLKDHIQRHLVVRDNPHTLLLKLCDVAIFAALCKVKGIESECRHQPLESEHAKNVFRQYRWERLVIPDHFAQRAYKTSNVTLNGMNVRMTLAQSQKYNPLELVTVLIAFDLQKEPTVGSIGRSERICLDFGLSRIHPELTIRDGYTTIGPILKLYGLEKFTEVLTNQIWTFLETLINNGEIQLCASTEAENEEVEEDLIVDEADVHEEPVEEVDPEELREAVEDEVAETLEEPVPERKKVKNRSVRNIPRGTLIRVFERLGLQQQRQNGTSHLILSGKDRIGHDQSYPIPVGKSDNSAPFVMGALRRFGLTREQFFAALEQI